MKKGKVKSILAFILSVLMVLGCISASMPMLALAAGGWVNVSSQTAYVPATLYVRRSTMSDGETYLLGVDAETRLVEVSNSSVVPKTVTTNSAGETAYYTSSSSTSAKYTASGAYLADESNSAYATSEITFSNNKLYNAASNLYITADSNNNLA